MTARAREHFRNWWPIVAFVVTALTFGGAWYQRTCALESQVSALSVSVSTLNTRTTTIEATTRQTSDDVRVIQDMLIQRSLYPVAEN